MRKIFLLALMVWMLLCAAIAQAAQITDVKWGVDKSNVLRLVVGITDTAGSGCYRFSRLCRGARGL